MDLRLLFVSLVIIACATARELTEYERELQANGKKRVIVKFSRESGLRRLRRENGAKFLRKLDNLPVALMELPAGRIEALKRTRGIE